MFRASHVSDGSRNAVEHLEAKQSSVASRFKRVVLSAASVAVLVTGLTGCTTLHNGWEAMHNNGSWNDTVIVLRNRSFSAKAWHRRKHNFCRERYIKDFCAGFRQGYEDVAGGAGECTPAFPPQSYWGWEFQSAEGQARTAAWFAGYPHGARAAEEDGVAHWNQIQMSTELQAMYQQHGTFEHQGTLYPIPSDQSYPEEVPMLDGPFNGQISDGQVIELGAEAIPMHPPAAVNGSVPQLLNPGQP